MATPAKPRLDRYRAKRDFAKTAEPSGEAAEPSLNGDRFVVQRHRARRLHYDLRLEMAGVLASWAVPKGPTLDPKARRLAAHVEDHPLDYFDFEGTIPAGEYGGGDVIVWDWGRWEPADGVDPVQAVADGELHFDLFGQKLAGRFVLLRRGDGSRRDEWLLLHKRDEFAVDGWDAEDHPTSVKSGRTNDEVVAAPDAVWHSNRGATPHATASWPAPSIDALAALDRLRTKGTWHVEGREVALTNLDKVLFPASSDAPALTKRDLIRYLVEVSPWMMPYLAGRPVNLHRYPNGVGAAGFWHKEVPSFAPEWLQRWRNPRAAAGETQWYLVPDGAASLAWIGNYGGLEIHPWTSRAASPDEPTWALIDIDPGTATTFAEVLVLARLYRAALAHLRVQGCPKVTGRRGIQIWVPVRDGVTFADTRRWVETVSRAVGDTVPELVSWEWHVDRRRGLARLDYTQNAVNKTLVAPFSPRPAPGGPVSVPITWDELDDPQLRPDQWHVSDVLARLRTVGDPLAPLIGAQQDLPDL